MLKYIHLSKHLCEHIIVLLSQVWVGFFFCLINVSVGLLAINFVLSGCFSVSPCFPLCEQVRSRVRGCRDCAQQLSGRVQDQQLQSKTRFSLAPTFSDVFLFILLHISRAVLSFFFFFVSAFASIQLIPGRSYRAANGLLSPPVEEPVRASQSSLCDILQEKEKKTSTSTGTGTSLGLAAGAGTAGTGMDHSALIHLRAKNFREKSDAHFVDVIREDRWVKSIQVDQFGLGFH